MEGLRTGRGTYGRYGGSPLRYAGGKSRIVGRIIERIPDDIEGLTSPFFGGGSAEIAAAAELGVPVSGYDVFPVLTDYWRCQISRPAQLADRIGEWSPDKKTYAAVKARLRAHWEGSEPFGDRLETAAHYWFNHNLSYGPGFLGWQSSIYADEGRVGRMLERVRRFRAPLLRVRPGSFEEVVPRAGGDFIYADPPYYLGGGSSVFAGIYPHRNLPVHHRGFDHALLREVLGEHRGGFLLSYNDCPEVRELYRGFGVESFPLRYSLGQGETRVGKNRAGGGYVKEGRELLISSPRR